MLSNSHLPARVGLCEQLLVLLLKFDEILSATGKVYTSQGNNNSVELFEWHPVSQNDWKSSPEGKNRVKLNSIVISV